jgi:hypothetical protein
MLLLVDDTVSAALVRRFLNTAVEDDYQFDFVDGPNPLSSSADGMQLFYRPPYFSYWPLSHSIDDIAAARRWLTSYMSERDPYDGIMMFSQGCTLGMSTLMYSEQESTAGSPPFKFAIFICGLPSLEELHQVFGFTVHSEAWEWNKMTELDEQPAALFHDAAYENAELDDLVTERFRPLLAGPCLVNIPTAHIVGARDPLYIHGLLLASLCNPNLRRIFDHGGGHEIPRNKTTSPQIAELIRWVSSE